MPCKETEGKAITQPEANKASRQNADPNFADNMGDVQEEYRPEAGKAFQKNVGANRQTNDNERTNIDTGNSVGSN